jgi:hypothetical protein
MRGEPLTRAYGWAMTRDDVLRELKAYRAHLAAEMRKTDAALKAFGVPADDAAPIRTSRGALVPTGERRPSSANEGGTYDMLRRLGGELPAGGSLDAREAIEAMEARGWRSDAQNPMNSVNTAMNRLAGWGEWEKVGRGRYRPKQTVDVVIDLTEPDAELAEPSPLLGGSVAHGVTVAPIFGRTDAAQA